MLARAEDSVLVVVDVQPTFLDPVWEKSRVLERSKFLIECANLLEVPIIATEQYPDRMGRTDPKLLAALDNRQSTIAKMSFSCWGEREFVRALERHKRAQVVMVGIETHICVTQSAHDLMDEDIDVIVCADAVSARSEMMHDTGLRRMADEGAAIAHTESVVYEWMQTAEHPAFKEVLKLVKSYS